jgi:teichuronic acid biosynthesis glycosyltransferase TuaC
MKILVVCSGTKGILNPFIKEQIESISKIGGIEFSLFQIKRGGILGYLSHFSNLIKTIKEVNPDLIHAHYGLSGLLANLQRKIPVITTFHGSDVYDPNVLKWSKWAHKLSAASIFVNQNMLKKFKTHRLSIVIPCGVDIKMFHPVPKDKSQEILCIDKNYRNVLFASEFGNPIKNYYLARDACNLVENMTGQKIKLIEMKGFSREEVNLYMNASDCLLLDSISEGSPQVIKEAMACNCPIVATDVGDIFHVIKGIDGCFLSSPNPEELSISLITALNFAEKVNKTKGRNKIVSHKLDAGSIAKQIIDFYKKVNENHSSTLIS